MRHLHVALVASFLLLLLVQGPRIVDPYIIERDYRSLGLFHAGSPLLTSLRTQTELATPAYTGLMLLAGKITSPALFAKLLAFPLLLVGVYYSYRLGAQLDGPGTALALALGFAVFNLGADTEVSVVAGLQRSFACPLLLALLFYLHNRRWAAAGLVVLLAGTIYLPIILVAVLTYALTLLHRKPDGKWELAIDRRHLVPLLLALLVVVLAATPVLLPRLASGVRSTIANLQEGRHLLTDPRYRPGGRGALFVIFPIFGRAGLVSSSSTAIQLIVLSLLALLVTGVRRRKVRPFPRVLRALFYAGVIAFALSWLALLVTSSTLLYLPSRHTEFAFFLLLVFYVFLNLEDTLNDLARAVQRQRSRLIRLGGIVLVLPLVALLASRGTGSTSGAWGALRWLLLALTLVFVILAALVVRRRRAGSPQKSEQPAAPPGSRIWAVLGAALLLISPIYIRATGPHFHEPDDEERALLSYLETLPADALIAGDPCSLDDVPYFTHRQVLFSCWRFGGQTAMDGLDAYYAESPAAIAEFCRQYGVDYLVVNEETLDPALIARGEYFYEPYVTRLRPTLKGRTDFALSRVPEEEKLFQAGSRFVMPCQTALPATGAEEGPGSSLLAALGTQQIISLPRVNLTKTVFVSVREVWIV